VAAGADFAYPRTTGRKPPGTDLVNRYLERVLRASHRADEVCAAVCEVQHLLRPPATLLRSAMAARVLLAERRTGTAVPAAPTAATS
jgi:hypothetical protein